jgi:hypothetical protein
MNQNFNTCSCQFEKNKGRQQTANFSLFRHTVDSFKWFWFLIVSRYRTILQNVWSSTRELRRRRLNRVLTRCDSACLLVAPPLRHALHTT